MGGMYGRWFSEPATSRFIDLCTLAKISMLALMDKYHGYYLHCRSSHTVSLSSRPRATRRSAVGSHNWLLSRRVQQHADANMAQLTNQLQQDTHKDKEIARCAVVSVRWSCRVGAVDKGSFDVGLLLRRGLDNCPDGSDLQMFELFVTENWRQHYDRVCVCFRAVCTGCFDAVSSHQFSAPAPDWANCKNHGETTATRLNPTGFSRCAWKPSAPKRIRRLC